MDTKKKKPLSWDGLRNDFLARAFREVVGPEGAPIQNDQIADYVLQRGHELQSDWFESTGRGQPVEPTVEDEGHGTKRYDHPAYAVVGISRVQGGDQSLFGSNVANHYGTLRLTIKEAALHRDAYSEHIYGSNRTIAEVELSEAQWAAFVSRPNHGDGVPCTLRYSRIGPLSAVPTIPRQPKPVERMEAQAEAMIATTQKHAENAVTELRKLIEARIPKKEQHSVLHLLSLVAGLGESTRNFQKDRLQAARDQMVTESRIEIESLTQSIVSNLGLETAQQLGALFRADPAKAVQLIALEGPQRTTKADYDNAEDA